MPPPPLSQIDVNLLVTLDVLLDECSVTRTARRLGLTQPAVSQALGRLRDLLDDPVLVRQGSKMVPTPRARDLAGPLRRLLADLHALISEQPAFDPAQATGRLNVAINDYVALVLVPPLLQRLRAEAPHLDVSFRAIPFDEASDALARGDLDLVAGVLPETPAAVRAAPVLEEHFTCLLRRGHPLADRLDLQAYAEADHLLISPRGRRQGGAVDAALEAEGLRRRVAVEVPYFLAAPSIIAATDLVITLPSRIAAAFAETYDLIQRPPPISLARFNLWMYWHTRFDRDPAQRWLRGLLIGLV